MSFINWLLYFLCFFFFFVYLFFKYRKRNYIVSPFNISFFTYSFSMLITPVFYYVNAAWYPLGIYSASVMYFYLEDAFMVNAVGYIIFLLVLLNKEFNRQIPVTLIKVSKRVANSISDITINTFFFLFLLLWHVICIIYCNGYPLLNGNRTFFVGTSITPVYQFLNLCLLLFTIYFALKHALYKKKMLFCVLGTITIALQANRSPLILSLLIPAFIVHIYSKSKKINNTVYLAKPSFQETKLVFLKNKRIIRKKVKKIFLFCMLMLLLGLLIQSIRKSEEFNIIQLFLEVIIGNTFSDIRDGAYILSGFKLSESSDYLYGKTYLSALLSFIPSSLSEFRTEWAWGRWTTVTLFGMSNHFGLRGGNSMEAYINFGWIGVVVSAFLQAIILSKLEKIFYMIFIIEKLNINGKEFFVYYILFLLFGVFSATSGMYNVYALICLIVMLTLSSSLIIRNYPKKLVLNKNR